MVCVGAMVSCELYVWLYGALLVIGEAKGENVNCCGIGPAELRIGSLSMLKVSRVNGIGGCRACGASVLP